MKKLVSIILALLILSVTASSFSFADDMQDAFLADLALSVTERFNANSSSTDTAALRLLLVENELAHLSKYKEIEFANKKFSDTANMYIEGCELQKQALKYYDSYYEGYTQVWAAGYYLRAHSLVALYDYYGVEIPDEVIANFRPYSGTSASASVQSKQNASPMISVEAGEYEGVTYGYAHFSFVAKNISDKAINTLTLNIELLDKDGNIILNTYPQKSSRVSPGQSITFEGLYAENANVSSIRVGGYSCYDDSDNYLKGFLDEGFVINVQKTN